MRKWRAFGSFAPLQFVLMVIAASVPLLLIASNWLVHQQFEENDAVRASVRQSYESRYALQQLMTLHLDLETAERGYVVTGDPIFLEPFNTAGGQIDTIFSRLREMTGPGQASPAEVRDLHRASVEKRRWAESLVELTRQGRAPEAARLIATGTGKRMMDRFRDSIDRIDSVEHLQLTQRLAQSEQDRQQLRFTVAALQTILLLLLLGGALVGARVDASRAKALVRIRQSNLRQTAIFDSAKDAMLLLDTKGCIRSLNPAAARMYGYGPREMQGQSVGMLYRDTPSAEQIQGFLSAVGARGSARQDREFEGRRKDGTTFPTEVAISAVSQEGGHNYLAVIRDITERKQVERLKSEFVSVVSHELRTPLTSIAGSLGLLAGGAAGALPERAARLVGIAQANSSRLVRLVNDILDIEKIEAGQMRFDLRPIALEALIDQCIQANTAFAAQYGVRITADPIGPGIAVLADDDRLTQVITNLMSNAIKFSPAGEEVRIAVTPGEASHRLSVCDHGPGIPDHFRDRIFQRFAQADASDVRQKGGTGLGLAIVSEIVSRMQGKVSFETEAGKGTTFHVNLPAASLPQESLDAAHSVRR